MSDRTTFTRWLRSVLHGALPLPAAALAQDAGSGPSLAADMADPRLMQGLETRSIDVGGVERLYFVHVPAAMRRPAPVLFMLHGGQGTAPRRAVQTGFNAIADREGFVAVYPQGLGNGWNDGRDTAFVLERHRHADDVAFFHAMFDALAAGGLGDRSRIYVVGGSNGGMMAHRLACEMAGRIAAMTVMVASMPVPLAPRCRPGRPMPMLMMNGTEDPLMPFAGGVVARAEENGRVVPAMDTVAFWRTHNACPEDATRSEVPDRDPADGMRTDVLSWSPCRDGTEVVFHRMNGAGHGLPGRSRTKSELAERLGGRSTNDFDSSEEAWAFVSRFVRTPGT